MSSGWKLAGLLGLATLIGTPLVALIWETINQLLAADIRPRQLAFAVPALLIAVVLVRVLARAVARLDDRTTPGESSQRPPG